MDQGKVKLSDFLELMAEADKKRILKSVNTDQLRALQSELSAEVDPDLKKEIDYFMDEK